MEISYKIPVSLFDYRESENPLYSFARLKIFYIGMTPDKRLFTKKFSDQLLRTLPYVPVVGYYSDEKDDFVGHNSKVQHIYGIVPEDAKVEYVKENGREYAVCDVMLYTGRNDDTGKIAQQIVGKSHSLELNPGDTTYQINHSMDGKLASIEFLTGSLLGLSVLGDDEQPAFTGSDFFTEFKELFSKDTLNSMNDFYRNTPCAFANKKNFARDSYEHRKTRAYNALKEMYPNVRYDIIQMTDDFIFYCEYIEDQNGTQKVHYKINYTDNNRVIDLIGGPEEVYETYLTEEELDMLDSYEPANELDYKTLQDLDLKPTESMAGNAKRGLELRREHGRGGTGVGVARARDISNRKNLSPQTVGRMYSYFSRHEVDKKGKGWNSGEDGYPSNGLIAWLLWGGDSGFSWATSKWNQIKKIREAHLIVANQEEFLIDLNQKELDYAESRPAPKSEQRTGSDENKPGSAEGPGGDITISAETETALKNKVEEHNEKMKEQDKPSYSRATLGQLKAVYRRGAGAYSTSHRPGMTRGQWAMARVNAYLYLLRNEKPENPKYTTDYDLLPKDHPKSTRENATSANTEASLNSSNKNNGVEVKILKNKENLSQDREEEVIEMAWTCDGMEHANCEQQPDGSFMCDGMKHDNCEKMGYHDEEKKDKDMKKDEDEEMTQDEKIKEEDMTADEEEDKKEDMAVEEKEDKEEQMELSGTENNIDGAGGQFEQEETQYADQESQEGKEINTLSLTDSEREELNALRQEVSEYRRIKKLSLIDSFKEDLSRSFIDELISKIDKYTLEELEVSLSKEFTRISKQEKQQSSKFKPLAYSGQNNNISASESKTDIVKRLVDQLK